MQPHAHARVALAEAGGEQRRERQRGRDRADPQRALEAAAQRGEPPGCSAVDVGERPVRPAEDPLALGREALEASRRGARAARRARARGCGSPADSVGCETWQAAAARPKWRSRSSAARYSSCRRNTRSIDRPPSIDAISRSTWTSAVLLDGDDGGARVDAISSSWSAATTRRDAPTALEVLKEAMDERGEITDDDRRGRRRALGPARGGGLRRLDLLRRPARAARRAPRARLHRHRVLRRDRRRPRRRAARRASASSSASARRTAPSRSPRPSASASATPSPGGPRRRRDRRRPGRRRARARRARARRRAEPRVGSLLDEPVLTAPGDWSGLRRALAELDARGAARGGQGRRRPRPRRRRLPRRARSGSSRATRRGRREVHRRQRRRGRPGLLHRQGA